MGITMKELAALANVSQSAVSLVLNDKGDGYIAKPRQELIRELARQHNYRPNMAAKGLRTSRQYTIGILMPAPVSIFFAGMVSKLQFELLKQGYIALFSFFQSDDELPKAYDAVIQHNVDGIISWVYHDCLDPELIPTVIGFYGKESFCRIDIDWEGYAHDAIDYLVSLGHTRIGFGMRLTEIRYRCLIKYLRELGLPDNPAWSIHALGTLEGGIKFMTQFMTLEDRPTSVIMSNDPMAYSAIALASRNGLKVPRDLSLIGYNNSKESSCFEPTLTTFDSHDLEVVDSLIEMILNRIENPSGPAILRSIAKPELIIRESCTTLK